MNKRIPMIRPPLFGNGAAADSRHWAFDLKNEILLANKIPADAVFNGASITRIALRVNRMLWALCAAYGAFYVDDHNAMADTYGLTMREGLAADGLHPHVFGCNVMAQGLKPLLESILKDGKGGVEP